MFLSNPRKALHLLIAFAAVSAACGSSQPAANRAVNAVFHSQPDIPFPLREPDVYQTDIILTAQGKEERSFYARKGDRSRLDTFVDGVAAKSELRNGSLFFIDHSTKTVQETTSLPDAPTPGIAADPARRFYTGRDRFTFEETGREGTVVKYRAFNDTSAGDIVIYFDTAAGLITRQEFLGPDGKADFVYELRNLKMEVDDSIFELPAGYKKLQK